MSSIDFHYTHIAKHSIGCDASLDLPSSQNATIARKKQLDFATMFKNKGKTYPLQCPELCTNTLYKYGDGHITQPTLSNDLYPQN